MAEIAAAVMLLVGAGLLARTFAELRPSRAPPLPLDPYDEPVSGDDY